MYVVDPGETVRIESATADPIGLKVGVAYEYDSDVRKTTTPNSLVFTLFSSKFNPILIITLLILSLFLILILVLILMLILMLILLLVKYVETTSALSAMEL